MVGHQVRFEDLAAELFDGGQPRLVLSVTGCSMAPTIVRGDRIHLLVASRETRVGDIVLARDAGGRYLIHRVREVSPRLITRGDALHEDDPPIERVLAHVERVETSWRSRLRRIYLRLRLAC